MRWPRRCSARRPADRTAVADLFTEDAARDLWLLRFAEDGRVEDDEEWAYWPGRPYTVEQT